MNRKFIFKRMLLLLLMVSLVVGVTAPFAVDAKKPDNFTPPGLAKKGVVVQFTFNDLRDVEWALQYIEKMLMQNIFTGYEDGSFRPNSPIKHVEAVVAAVRLLGLEDEAKAKAGTKLNFEDAKEIAKKYPWATGYIAVALENGLFDSTVTKLQPEKSASRLWITTLLVRAMDLEDEALAKMNTQLTFKDASSIPAGAVGYVAVAIEEGLIQGYPDNTFQPNKPVTRAEMAALLDRTGDNLNPGTDEGVRTGVVKAVNASAKTITIEEQTATKTYTLADNVLIFRNTGIVEVADIKVGDTVTLQLWQNQVRFIEIQKSGTETTVYDGEFVSVTTKNNQTVLNFKVKSVNYAYVISPIVELKLGTGVTLKDLKAGDQVRVTVTDKVVTKIELLQQTGEVVYDAEFISLASKNNQVWMSFVERTKTYEYAISPTVEVKLGDGYTLRDLRKGDKVKVTVKNQVITKVEKIKLADEIVVHEGDFISLATKNNQVVMSFKAAGITYEYAVSPLVEVKLGDGIALKDLRKGDFIRVTVTNKVITKVEGAIKRFDINGKISAIKWNGTNQTGELSVRLADNSTVLLVIDQNTRVRYDGKLIAVTSLLVDDEVSVKVEGDKAVNIEVTKRGQIGTEPVLPPIDKVENISGEFEGVLLGYQLPGKGQGGYIFFRIEEEMDDDDDDYDDRLKRQLNGKEFQFAIAKNIRFEANDKRMDLSMLENYMEGNYKFEIKVRNGVIEKIELED